MDFEDWWQEKGKNIFFKVEKDNARRAFDAGYRAREEEK